MAKNNNLTDFLTDLADAIREKKGVTYKINPQDFSKEIASIEVGETTITDAPIKDVNFYDYDGSRLYSYSWDEILTMTELPTLPVRKGLVCQGWNYTLEDILLQSHHKADVGANYTTEDDTTKMYINILADNTTIELSINNDASSKIDWGDGTTSMHNSEGHHTYSHTYLSAKNYIISINNTGYVGGYVEDKFINQTLQKIHFGSGVSPRLSFKFDLKQVSLSSTSTSYYSANYGSFYRNVSMDAVIIPKGSTLWGQPFTFSGLKVISLPTDIIFTEYNSAAELYAYDFAWNSRLCRLVLPEGFPEIGSGMFQNCSVLSELWIPSSVTHIRDLAFKGCNYLTEFDFSHFTSVPSISGSPFNVDNPLTIIVPDELYDDWKSKWSKYSSYIVKASEQ